MEITFLSEALVGVASFVWKKHNRQLAVTAAASPPPPCTPEKLRVLEMMHAQFVATCSLVATALFA